MDYIIDHLRVPLLPRRPMSQLPTELLISIVNHIGCVVGEVPTNEVQHALSSLCFASKTLCSLAQPLLFQSIDVPVETRKDVKAWVLRLQRLASLLQSRPHIRPWVKSLKALRKEYIGFAKDFAQAFLAAVTRMTDLRILHLSRNTISPQLLTHVSQLPALEELQTWATFSTTSLAEFSDALGVWVSPTLRRLSWGPPRPLSRDDAFVDIQARLTLSPELTKLEIFDTRVAAKVFSFLKEPLNLRFCKLEYLALAAPQRNPHHWESLGCMLAACPNVTFLDITCYAYWEDQEDLPNTVLPELPATAVPNLHHLRARSWPIASIVCGRPVEILEAQEVLQMNDFALTDSALESWAAGSVPVRKLVLAGTQWHDGLLAEIIEKFPQLRYLELHYTRPFEDAVVVSLSVTAIRFAYKVASSHGLHPAYSTTKSFGKTSCEQFHLKNSSCSAKL